MEYTETDAIISDCGEYRYMLRRVWDRTKPVCLFIGLNPSTADATQDDPTIRRCVGFADSWGYGTLMMGNLFAFRATDPKDMKKASDPVGGLNDHWLQRIGAGSTVVAAWGAHGDYMHRGERVRDDFRLEGLKLHHLGLTKAGQPKHPLYLRADTQLVSWQ